MVELEAAAAKAAADAAMKAQLDALRDERMQSEQARKRRLLEQHRAKQARLEMEMLHAKERELQAQQEADALQAELNKERVEVRRDMLAAKEAARREREAAARREQELLQERLTQLAQSTPYFDRIDALVPDREHVLQHTRATEEYSRLGQAHAAFLAAGGDVTKLVGTGDKSDLAVHRLQERGVFMKEGCVEWFLCVCVCPFFALIFVS